MRGPAVVAILWVVVVAVYIVLFRRQRRRRIHVGPGAAGAIYDMLNEDKRNAIEIIVEQRAEERDPEDRDGNLPDLDTPGRR